MGIIMKTIRRSYSSDMRKEDDPTQLIKDFMEKHNITNYTINPDKSVDVNDNIIIRKKDLIDGKLPFKFNMVKRNFICSEMNLTTLEGCPKEVGGSFSCSGNNLTSLKYAPEKIGGSCFVSANQKLTSLEGCPKKVGHDFYCSYIDKKFKESDIRHYCDVSKIIF